MTSIGNYVFDGCSKLARVQYNAQTITSAFAGLDSLVLVSLGSGVTTIDTNAFKDCKNLKRILIPKAVTKIEADAFSGCTGLTTIEYGGSETDWNDIYIGSGNDALSNSNIIFNSEIPAKPSVVIGRTETNYEFTVTVDVPQLNSYVYAVVYDAEGNINSIC